MLGKGDVSHHLRPTTDKVRESVFNVLSSMCAVVGSRVLDVFAGTGALGLEALSRGAASAVFVENGAISLRLLRRNISQFDLADRAHILPRDATRLGKNRDLGFSLVFMDPPYGSDESRTALRQIVQGRWLASEAFVVWEDSVPAACPEGFIVRDRRVYGTTHVTLLQFGYAPSARMSDRMRKSSVESRIAHAKPTPFRKYVDGRLSKLFHAASWVIDE